jgi:O-antigen/teichoic acid export membrane protein
MKESSLAYSLQNILKVLLTLALFFLLGASAKTLAIAFILSYMPIAFYLLFVSHNALKPISTNEPMQLSRYLPMLYELVPFGLTMVGVVLFSTIIGYTDRVMLGFYLQSQANAQIAIYTMAISFAGIGALFASSVLTILFPISSELVGKGELARLNQTAKTAMRWVLFSSVPIVAFIAAFSSPLLRLLYGAAYEPGAIAMSIYTIGVFAGLFGSVQRTTLAGMRLIKIELLSVIAGSIVNVGLNMIFIPLWGINGAAFASLMAFASMSAVNQYFAKRYCKFTIPNPAWKNLAAGIFIFILLSAISWLAYPYLTSFAIIGKGESLLMIIADKVAKLAILGIFFAISVLLYVIAINLMHLPEEEDTYIMHRILSKMQIPQKISNLIVSFAIWDSHHHLKNKG